MSLVAPKEVTLKRNLAPQKRSRSLPLAVSSMNPWQYLIAPVVICLERAHSPRFGKLRTELRLGRQSVVCFSQFSVNCRYLFFRRVLR
jgi:hypothetical protein